MVLGTELGMWPRRDGIQGDLVDTHGYYGYYGYCAYCDTIPTDTTDTALTTGRSGRNVGHDLEVL